MSLSEEIQWNLPLRINASRHKIAKLMFAPSSVRFTGSIRDFCLLSSSDLKLNSTHKNHCHISFVVLCKCQSKTAKPTKLNVYGTSLKMYLVHKSGWLWKKTANIMVYDIASEEEMKHHRQIMNLICPIHVYPCRTKWEVVVFEDASRIQPICKYVQISL